MTMPMTITNYRWENSLAAFMATWWAFATTADNPYDAQAVRVDNMRGQKVGHIKREQAAAIALVMDRFSGAAVTLDASIPSAGNRWKLPIRIDFCATKEVAAQVQQLLASKGLRLQELWADGRPKSLPNNHTQQQQQQQQPQQQTQQQPQQQPVVLKTRLNWTNQRANLDAMFESQSKAQLAQLPAVDFDKLPLTSDLFQHQKTGIQWLLHKEQGQAVVPFYRKVQEQGKTAWLSDITHCSQAVAPMPVRGGILADEMGTLFFLLC